jgi:hypothetical protein
VYADGDVYEGSMDDDGRRQGPWVCKEVNGKFLTLASLLCVDDDILDGKARAAPRPGACLRMLCCARLPFSESFRSRLNLKAPPSRIPRATPSPAVVGAAFDFPF